MKLRFIIDKGYDLELAKGFGFSSASLEYIDRFYANSSVALKLTQELYQSSWDAINDKFSKYIEEETGYKWFYPEYECVVSAIHIGISSWGNAPKIARIWKENPYSMRRITAHELILSHYFEIYKRHFKHEGLIDGQIWALAEIAAFALTSLTDQVEEFWPWNTEYYTDHNYPHIVDLQNQLKEPFIKRKDFAEYIKKGIELIRKYPNMSPSSIQ